MYILRRVCKKARRAQHSSVCKEAPESVEFFGGTSVADIQQPSKQKKVRSAKSNFSGDCKYSCFRSVWRSALKNLHPILQFSSTAFSPGGKTPSSQQFCTVSDRHTVLFYFGIFAIPYPYPYEIRGGEHSFWGACVCVNRSKLLLEYPVCPIPRRAKKKKPSAAERAKKILWCWWRQ